MNSKTGSPYVVGVDRFYMTDEAIVTINTAGQIVWADSKTEDELIAKLRQINAKVIISEY